MTILVVDDSPSDVDLLRYAFDRTSRSGPFHVRLLTLPSGRKTIDYLAGEGDFADREGHPLPDAILLDLKMPDIDGFEVLRWLRRQPGLKRIITIVHSSSERQEDVDRAYDLGAAAFVVKPTTLTDLTSFTRVLSEWLSIQQRPTLDVHGETE